MFGSKQSPWKSQTVKRCSSVLPARRLGIKGGLKVKNKSLGHFMTIVKKDLKVFSKDLPVYCLLTLVFPLCLGFFYGLMYQNIMEQEVKLSPLTVYHYSTTDDHARECLLQTFNS